MILRMTIHDQLGPQVLTDPSYAQRATELQSMMLKTKGAEAAPQWLAPSRMMGLLGLAFFFTALLVKASMLPWLQMEA